MFSATTGAQALSLSDQHQPDVILLDWGLPDISGIELARQLRREGEAAVIMITARFSIEDRVNGLYAGADDYLVKPFSNVELRARIHAQLRARVSPHSQPQQEVRLNFGAVVLEPSTLRCLVNGQLLSLSPREFELLLILAKHPERVFSQAELMSLTQHGKSEPRSNTLEVRVGAIRRAFRGVGMENIIKTVRGAGYFFRSPPS